MHSLTCASKSGTVVLLSSIHSEVTRYIFLLLFVVVLFSLHSVRAAPRHLWAQAKKKSRTHPFFNTAAIMTTGFFTLMKLCNSDFNKVEDMVYSLIPYDEHPFKVKQVACRFLGRFFL